MKRPSDINSKKSAPKKVNSSKESPIFSAHPAAKKDDKDTLHTRTELWITIIDVGQGESTLIRYRKKKAGKKWEDLHVVLVDGGHTHFAAQTISPTLEKLKVKKINTMVCSHYDADHMEGLTALLSDYPPDTLYERSSAARADEDKILKFRKSCDAIREQITIGEIIDLGTEGNFPQIECVAVDNKNSLWSDENDYSIALLIRFGGFSFYLGGDLTSKVEDELEIGTHVCAFKCGHHGSKHSTSEAFLAKINATAAFISAASHSYCHPDDEIIKRLCDNKTIKKIYLTNCVYNRAGINPDFETQELSLKKKIYSDIKEWLADDHNLSLISNRPPGFDELLKLIIENKDKKKGVAEIETARDKIFEELLKKEKLEIKSGEISKHLSGEQNKPDRKKWNDLAGHYYTVYDINKQMAERKERAKTKKGVVAATAANIGNFHLIVSGEDAVAKNHKFKVYFSDDTKMKMIQHECGKDAPAEADADRAKAKLVARKAEYPFKSSFSLPTGPSGKERENFIPNEVLELLDKIDDFLISIINTDLDLESVDKMIAKIRDGIALEIDESDELIALEDEFDELITYYEEVRDDWQGEKPLKNPYDDPLKELRDKRQTLIAEENDSGGEDYEDEGEDPSSQNDDYMQDDGESEE